jgi:alkylated DNA nucleotide flippase Atl1
MTLFPDRKPLTHKAAVTTFGERVVALALKIPPGRVTTYKILAKKAGGGGMAHRSVTAILGKAWNKGETRIPWHRIVYSDGRVWISPTTRKKRLALYKKEHIILDKNNRVVDFFDKLFEFN